MAENSNRSVEVGGDAHGAIIVTGDANVVQILREKPRDITKAPYKFLSYYDIGDRDIFFGRDTVIDELAGLISQHKVVIINGQSGSGKTSLINAGLIPRLADNGYLYIAFRDYSDPLQQLRDYLDDSPDFTIPDVDQMSLLQIMRAIREQQSRVVVIFDQFERFFVGIKEQEKRRTFLKELKQCLDSELTADELNLVLSLREDFLGRLMSETAKMIPELLQEGPPYPLLPLGRDEARQAIVGPLTLVDHKIDYDDRFVDEVLLPDLSREATGDSQIEPPHLQIVCNKLYEEACRRNAEKLETRRLVVIERGLYEELGEAKGMLRGYLDDVVKQVSDGNEDAVHSTLKLMIETVGTRKFVSANAIQNGLANVAEDETTILLKKLHEARVVETRGSGNDFAYSLSHEVMVDKVREWHDPGEIRLKRAEETLERGRRQWKDNQKTVLDEEQVSLVKDCLSETLTDSDRELIGRSEKRHRTLRLIKRTAIVAVVVCLILLPIAIWKSVQASNNEGVARARTTEANEAKEKAEKDQIAAEKLLAESYIRTGATELKNGDVARAVAWFNAAYQNAPESQHEPWPTIARSLVGSWSRGLGEPMMHDLPVLAVAFSPDGCTVATGSADKTARLWDAQSGAARGQPMVHEDSVHAVAFSSDGKTLLTGSRDCAGRLWNSQSGDAISAPTVYANLGNIVAFSPDARIVATSSGDGRARLWDAETGTALCESMKHIGPRITAVAFSPDGKTVLTGCGAYSGNDGEARLWDSELGTARGEPMVHRGTVNAVAFSPDGKTLLTVSDDHVAQLWDAETGAVRGQPMVHKDSVNAVAFSHDGETVLTGSGNPVRIADGEAQLWNAQSGVAIGEPMVHKGAVSAVAFSPDDRTVLTGSNDGMARLWKDQTGTAGQPMNHADPVSAVAFGPDGKSILTANGGEARLWDTETRTAPGHPMKHKSFISAMSFSRDGETVLTVSRDHTVRLWNGKSGRPRGVPMHREGSVEATAFGPDGMSILTASYNDHDEPYEARLWDAETGVARSQTMKHENVHLVALGPDGKTVLTGGHRAARLWDAETGAARGQEMVHKDRVNAVAFSPDGKIVLTASGDSVNNSGDGYAQLWNAQTGVTIGEPMMYEGAVTTVAFSPYGERVLAGSRDSTARLWDGKTGTALGEPMVHEGAITTVAFSPDGKTMLTGSWDHTARLWDVKTGTPLGEPMRHEDRVTAVAFSPDGKTVLTGSDDKTARLWDVSLPALDDRKRLKLSVEVRTGFFIDEQGRLERLTQADWLNRKQQLKRVGGPCDIIP